MLSNSDGRLPRRLFGEFQVMRIIKRALLLTASLALPMSPAMAADYDPPVYVEPAAAAEEYVPVEVGSGWYLRGDIGYAVNKPYDFNEEPDGYTTSDSPISASVGMGYHFNDYFRGELNLGLLPTSKFDTDSAAFCEGTETVTVTNPDGSTSAFSGRSVRGCEGETGGTNKAYNLMANAYVDLGTFSGFTPYIGGGIGVAYTNYRSYVGDRDCVDDSTTVGNTTTIFACDPASTYDGESESERQYNFAYSIGAGFGYQVTKNTTLDFGYEYFAIPEAKYVALTGDGSEIKKGLDYHQLKVALRYDLW
jgi:opacity protein-like surface antigen